MSISASLDGLPDDKDDLYFLEFLTFRVEGTLFRVPTFKFNLGNSELLQQLRSGNEDVVELAGISKAAFKALLLVMYPFQRTAETYDEWIGALELATLWGLKSVRSEALSAISTLVEFKAQSAIEAVIFAKKYSHWPWLREAYVRLVKQETLDINTLRPSMDDAGNLDWEAIARVQQARAQFRRWTASGSPKPQYCLNCLNKGDKARNFRGMLYTPFYICRTHPTAEECTNTAFHNELVRMASNDDRGYLAGQRLARRTGETTPGRQDIEETGPPICHDNNGSPTWIGSAMEGGAVIPCKVYHDYGVFVPIPGRIGEQLHDGHYDALIYNPDKMELVLTSRGEIPINRRPVQGGYDLEGLQLYHAVATVEPDTEDEIRVPGRTGVHMGCAKVTWGGNEYRVFENYEILCWK